MSDERNLSLSRRNLLAAGGAGLAGLAMTGPTSGAPLSPTETDTGRDEGGRVTFPNWRAESERPEAPVPKPLPPDRRVGFAIVGLGRLSLNEILPAFAESKKAKAVALVSGSPEKARLTAAQYGIAPEAIYDYAGFDRIADNPAIQAVYIVLPNGMHHEFVLRAARAGKQVLCEKPMALDSAEAREMIAACEAARVKLMIAYRCQYEPYNRELLRIARSGELGPIRLIEASNVQNTGRGDQWRLRKAMAGGGALPDIGIYCLNAMRFITGEEPSEVQAQIHSPPDDPRFREVEETATFLLRFPSGVMATGTTCYGVHEARDLKVHLPGGHLDLENAFAYQGQRLHVARRSGKAEGEEERILGRKNQFALEIDHMATCILDDRRPRTQGEEGLRDHLAMEAIYEAARTGATVKLAAVAGRDTSRGPELDETG